MTEELKAYTANVFLPGCLGPVRREVVLLSDHEEYVEALRAQLHSLQGAGEAVEVVGYGCAGQIEVLKHVPLTGGMKVSGREREKYSVPLMTVAQHQRIMAASVGSAEPVAMKTHGAWDGMDDLKDLPDGTELYTHLADPGAVAVQEMQWLEQWLLLAAEPVGQECCGQAYLECCGNAVLVYRTADEIAAAMNARREELRALLANAALQAKL